MENRLGPPQLVSLLEMVPRRSWYAQGGRFVVVGTHAGAILRVPITTGSLASLTL